MTSPMYWRGKSQHVCSSWKRYLSLWRYGTDVCPGLLESACFGAYEVQKFQVWPGYIYPLHSKKKTCHINGGQTKPKSQQRLSICSSLVVIVWRRRTVCLLPHPCIPLTGGVSWSLTDGQSCVFTFNQHNWLLGACRPRVCMGGPHLSKYCHQGWVRNRTRNKADWAWARWRAGLCMSSTSTEAQAFQLPESMALSMTTTTWQCSAPMSDE